MESGKNVSNRTNNVTGFTLLVLVCIFLCGQQRALARPGLATDQVVPDIRQALQHGTAQEVIVEFDDARIRTDASDLRRKGNHQFETAEVLDFKKNEYAKLKRASVALMPGKDYDSLIDYSHLPMTFMRIKSVAALDALLADPRIRKIHRNAPKYPVLDSVSANFVNLPLVAARGLTGAGGTVAVIDTGLNYTLSDFGSCTAPGVPAGCKVSYYNNLAGTGSSLDANGHGTNVAGTPGAVQDPKSLSV